MTCPECQSNQLIVIDSRAYKGGIHRRRKCVDCGASFATHEEIGSKYRKNISLEVKQKCVELARQGMTAKEIYSDYFEKQHSGTTLKSFNSMLSIWKKKHALHD